VDGRGLRWPAVIPIWRASRKEIAIFASDAFGAEKRAGSLKAALKTQQPLEL
jgi:hypothetical protein